MIAWIVRSYYGSTNFNKMRELLQERASLDPLEIDDLRLANDELNLLVFQEIMKNVIQDFPAKTATYKEFVWSVRRTMKRMKGDAFTIQLGHLIDRIVLDALADHGKHSDEPQPIAFFLTALSLAMHGPVPERTRALFEVAEQSLEHKGDQVTLENVRTMVGYLQDTCQLVTDAQIVESSQKYPSQKYERGDKGKLLEWDGTEKDIIDVDAFSAIIRSRAVCAWGECFRLRKNV